jgi:hypothetical protein
MNLTIEREIQNPKFLEYLREGTLAHCKKLWKAGMISEALEIGKEFQIKKEEIIQAS